jgi:V-type H+-transporting ATPase subunit G
MSVSSFVDQFSQHAGTTSTTQDALDKDTNFRLNEIDAVFQRKKDGVVSSLLARAMFVHLELHRNLEKVNAS